MDKVAAAEFSWCMKWTAQDTVYTCPACGRGTAVNESIHHCLEHCGDYMAMSSNQRAECLEKFNCCPIHLVGSHKYSECNLKSNPRYVCGVDDCSKHHHKVLHGSTSSFLANVLSTFGTSKPSASIDYILLSSQSIPAFKGSLYCIFDNAATCSLITETAAKAWIWLERKLTWILLLSMVLRLSILQYIMSVIERKNNKHTINAL